MEITIDTERLIYTYCSLHGETSKSIHGSQYVWARVGVFSRRDNTCICRRESINNFRMAHGSGAAAVKAETF